MDALAHVVRVFRDDAVPHIKVSIDPKRDIDSMELDLILADLSTPAQTPGNSQSPDDMPALWEGMD